VKIALAFDLQVRACSLRSAAAAAAAAAVNTDRPWRPVSIEFPGPYFSVRVSSVGAFLLDMNGVGGALILGLVCLVVLVLRMGDW
jgi:hypothetical protein